MSIAGQNIARIPGVFWSAGAAGRILCIPSNGWPPAKPAIDASFASNLDLSWGLILQSSGPKCPKLFRNFESTDRSLSLFVQNLVGPLKRIARSRCESCPMEALAPCSNESE